MKQILRLLVAITVASTATAAEKPNVLFISLDDLNDWVGCMGGHPQAKTPNIDKLAASGMLFNNAHCAAPACNPSRSAVFTGVSPHVSGMYRNEQKLRDVMPSATLLPKYFSNNGYHTAGSGKMLHYFIDAQSWDEYYPEKHTENPFPPHIDWGKRPKSLPRGGKWQYVETDWHAFDVTDDEFGGDAKVADYVSGKLMEEHDKPFFLACGIYRPHEPWFVPKKYFDMFPLEEVQLPPGYKEGDLDDLPEAGKKAGPNRYFSHIRKHGQWKQAVQAYLASIAYADAMVGRVLDTLEKSPHKDNTIVVLWSDHGWHLGEKEHWQKFTCWRASTRVPLIIRVPEGVVKGGLAKPGSVCVQSVSLLSLYKTLTELCGIERGRRGYRGDRDIPSLLPLLRNPEKRWKYFAMTFSHNVETLTFSVSSKQFRYIHYTDGSEELYDIQKDPYEWTNLAGHPGYAPVVRAFQAELPKNYSRVIGLNDDKLPVLNLRAGKPPRSAENGNWVDVLVENQLMKRVTFSWVMPNGSYRPGRAVLEPGQRIRAHTRVGAVWHSSEVGHFIVGDKPARVIINKE